LIFATRLDVMSLVTTGMRNVFLERAFSDVSGECPEDGKDGLRALERLARSQIARCLAGVAHFFQALKSRLVAGVYEVQQHPKSSI
jgi:hypothetical protein